jgi:hypothetical protein
VALSKFVAKLILMSRLSRAARSARAWARSR